MPTYEYETVPAKEGDPVRRYEFQQRMSDEPLKKHPETGEPLRRVYSAFAVGGSSSGSNDGCECAAGGHHHHSGSCGCGCQGV
jgi:predicted nucleic acid-binding Zn ribbon protein